MKPWSMVLGCAALICACAASAASLSLDELVARHTAARGGAAAIEAVKAVEIEVQIEEPTYKANGIYVATREGRMRIVVSIDGKPVYSEGLDGAGSWS